MIKKVLSGVVVGLVIITVTALGATWLYAPKPPIQTDNSTVTYQVIETAPLTAEEKLAAGQRVCAKINKFMKDTGGTIEPPLTVADCLEANRSCVKLWGPHSIWAGAADLDNVPYCDCDVGYKWLYGSTPGTGKCVAQQ